MTDLEPPSSSLVPLLLMVSVWFEPTDPPGFRARVSATAADGHLITRHVTADPETVPTAVRAWLDELLHEEVS